MSKHNRDRRRPKYAKGVIAAALLGRAAGVVRPGTVCEIPVYHDDWCRLLNGTGPCDCDPVVGQPVRVPEVPG